MAGRIRTIKPEILDDEKTASLTDGAFRLFVGVILLADDHGNLRGGDRWLDGQIYWGGGSPRAAEFLRELLRADLVDAYEVAGQFYLHIVNWCRHQRVDNAGKPRVPTPDQGNPAVTPSIAENLREPPRESASLGGLPPDPDHRPRPPTPTTDPRPSSVEPPTTEDEAQIVVGYLNKRTGRTGRSKFLCKGQTRDLVNARLKTHAVRDLRLVVWHKSREWKGTEFAKFLRPGTLFLRSKFDDYLADAEKAHAETKKPSEPWTASPLLQEALGAR